MMLLHIIIGGLSLFPVLPQHFLLRSLSNVNEARASVMVPVTTQSEYLRKVGAQTRIYDIFKTVLRWFSVLWCGRALVCVESAAVIFSLFLAHSFCAINQRDSSFTVAHHNIFRHISSIHACAKELRIYAALPTPFVQVLTLGSDQFQLN